MFEQCQTFSNQKPITQEEFIANITKAKKLIEENTEPVFYGILTKRHIFLIQSKKHRRKRINKKWLKKYGKEPEAINENEVLKVKGMFGMPDRILAYPKMYYHLKQTGKFKVDDYLDGGLYPFLAKPIGVKYESNQSNERVFTNRGQEGLFLRAFGKRNIR